MKNILFSMMLFVSTICCAQPQQANYDVVPMPESVVLSNKAGFVLDNTALIAFPEANEEMENNARFLQEYIEKNTGIKSHISTNLKTSNIRLVLDSEVIGDEAYCIIVNNKTVTVKSSTATGVFYGIQTLRKSLPVCKTDKVVLPAVCIKDAPRFAYRGMMLDCARHFFPINFVKEYIDLMAMHNMNTFHWHLTDDQGWRIEIKKYPLLTKVGSVRRRTTIGHNSQIYDNIPYGGFYTQDEAREIVEYARQRHITVIPEIDMPGHQKAALAAYPSLGCTGGPYEVGSNWGVFLDVFCLGNEEVYQFCEDVWSEILDIFPSKMIHIGGDESPNERWKECNKCQGLMQRTGTNPKTVQGYFTNRMEKFLNSKGRSIIGWDEILDGDINKSATIQSWRGTEPGIKAAMAGHDVIMSPTTYCYFDYQQADPRKFDEPSRCTGLIPMEKVYSMNILPDDMTDENVRKHFIGVQANLWCEYVNTPALAEYQVLPRMAALCEEQWCEKKGTWENFLPRLTRLTSLYDLYNLQYAKHLWPERILPPDTDW